MPVMEAPAALPGLGRRRQVRLEPGTTKNGDGREFAMTSALRLLLEQRLALAKTAKVVGLKLDPNAFVFTHKQ